MIELLSYPFMQRALIAAVFTGLAAPTIGTYLVQRRLALMGDGLGHVAVTGVALGLLTGASPTWTAVIVAVVGAVLIEVIRERGRSGGDVALALLFYGGIAGGVMITGLAGQSAARLQQFLFGSITSISVADIWFTMALSVVVTVVCLGARPQLFAVSHDPDFARVAGLRVRAWNLLVAVLAAVTVTVAMRTVGLLLVSALMVIPVATATQVTRTFRSTMLAAMALGAGAGVGGLLLAAAGSLAASDAGSDAQVSPGAAIVLLALVGFGLAWPVGVLTRRRDRRTVPFQVDSPLSSEPVPHHPHQHGEGCGHDAVLHGDHVDYLHDGHRHAAHGSHYDEH